MEESLDVVMGTLRVFNFDAYALLDTSTNMYFFTPYLANKFVISPNILKEPYSVYI